MTGRVVLAAMPNDKGTSPLVIGTASKITKSLLISNYVSFEKKHKCKKNLDFLKEISIRDERLFSKINFHEVFQMIVPGFFIPTSHKRIK